MKKILLKITPITNTILIIVIAKIVFNAFKYTIIPTFMENTWFWLGMITFYVFIWDELKKKRHN